MGPVGAKTRRRTAGTGLETRERWGTLLHSILDTYARTCTLWLAYVRTSVLRDREAAGLLIGRILPIERTRGLSRSLSLPPERTLFNQPPRFDLERSRSREQWSIGFRLSLANIPCSFYARFYCFRYPISINQLAPLEKWTVERGVNKSFFNNSERAERRIFNLNFFDYKRVNSIEEGRG